MVIKLSTPWEPLHIPPPGPSPIWAKVVAILVVLISISAAANAIYFEVVGFQQITASDDNFSQEHEEMIEELKQSNVKSISIYLGLAVFFSGLITAAFVWSRHEKMLFVGITWSVLKLASDVWIALISGPIIAKYMNSIPGGGDYSWIAKSSAISSSLCGFTMIGILVVLSFMYKVEDQSLGSGFHLNVDEPSTES